MDKEAIEFIESKKRFCESMIEIKQDYTTSTYKDMVKQNRIYEFILSKLKSDEDNYINKNTNLKQALIDIRKTIIECKMLMPHEFDWDEQGDNILQIIDKVLGGKPKEIEKIELLENYIVRCDKNFDSKFISTVLTNNNATDNEIKYKLNQVIDQLNYLLEKEDD